MDKRPVPAPPVDQWIDGIIERYPHFTREDARLYIIQELTELFEQIEPNEEATDGREAAVRTAEDSHLCRGWS